VAGQLQASWVTIATTAVIAHYNAAVESEFMSLWKEAEKEYETAYKLALHVMNPDNPMTQRIRSALAKMRIKVRNGV